MTIPYLRLNPCGVEGEPSTHCKYVKECTTLGRDSGRLICLSQFGYQVAKYLLAESNAETERVDVGNHLRNSRNLPVVDPRASSWEPKNLELLEFESIRDEIISRGQQVAAQSSSKTLPKRRDDPLNFLCSTEDIVADLF